MKGGRDLTSAVLWPTSTASDAKGSRRATTVKIGEGTSHDGTTLLDAVMLYPTPTAASYGSSNNGNPGDSRTEYATKGKPSRETMAKAQGALLNASWVEALMGFPVGWSSVDGPPRQAKNKKRGSPRAPSKKAKTRNVVKG
jgi:hypothetical protein